MSKYFSKAKEKRNNENIDINIEGIKVNNEKYVIYLLFEDKPSLSISFLIDFFISTKININKIKSKKKIITIHDLIHEKYPNYYNFKDLIQVKKKIFQHIDNFICVSHSTKEDLLNIYDVPQEKVQVIYHGSNHLDKILVDISKKKFEFLKKIEKPIILYVGNRYRYKSFKTLINSFNNSSFLKNNFQIVFFGGEAVSKNERQLYNELNLNNKIFHINGDDEILKHLYMTAKAMVSTSDYEGFGLNILEALRYGCIVLAKDIKVFKEIYSDKIIYFNDDETLRINLEKYLQMSNLQNMNKNNDFVDKFTWEQTCSKMLKVYENC